MQPVNLHPHHFLSSGISFPVNSAFFQLLRAYKITFCKPCHNKLWFPLLGTFNYLHPVIWNKNFAVISLVFLDQTKILIIGEESVSWNEELMINVFNRIFIALCDIAPNEGNFKISVLTTTAVRITDQILSSNVFLQVK